MSILDAEFREFNTAAGVSLRGNTPPNVPELLANIWTSYRLFDALELGGSFRYVGEREGDNANQFQLPSYFALGLYGRYTYKQWQFTVRGRNITDELIVSWAETDFGEQVQIENPASVEVSVSATF